MEEVELAEVLDHLLFDRALEGEVELLQRFAGREAPRGCGSRRRGCRARRSRWTAARARSAHNSTPPGAHVRRASATRGPRRALSIGGTGARARRWCSSLPQPARGLGDLLGVLGAAQELQRQLARRGESQVCEHLLSVRWLAGERVNDARPVEQPDSDLEEWIRPRSALTVRKASVRGTEVTVSA